MLDEEPPLTGSAVGVLCQALRQLRRECGKPSTRAIAAGVDCSHVSVAEAFSGRRLVGWYITEQIVRFLDGDAGEFKRLWIAADKELHEPRVSELLEAIPVQDGSDSGDAPARPKFRVKIDPSTRTYDIDFFPSCDVDFAVALLRKLTAREGIE